MPTLAEQSISDRAKKRPVKIFGDPIAAGYADRDRKAVTALAYTAAALAASERKRHGRESTPDERQDAAQDALVWAYADGDGQPTAADLIDPDRQTVSTFDGSRESFRPSRELIAAAGASLDRAHSARALLDPAAGSGTLIEQSAATRLEGEARRSVAAQLVDPSVSPLPHPVADAIRQAGIWPDDPTRQAIIDALCPDLTAQDWLEAGEKGNTPETIRKRRERAAKLHADPKARTFADALRPSLGATPAERREGATRAAERMLESNPDGPRSEGAKLIDPAWRTRQPFTHPVKVSTPAADREA